MSFLNPVNEPVLRFSSTDASAPQINYAARTAGDVKAVLKACLVTGYGAKASAGWTAANETATVIEFVSPSVAMSDYRLGIDDTSASSTTWYYQYQDARINPAHNTPTKHFINVDKVSVKNGWQLIVSNRGLFFIETAYRSDADAQTSRLTYLGQVKSALSDSDERNMAFFVAGLGAPVGYPSSVFDAASYPNRDYRVGIYNQMQFSYVNVSSFSSTASLVASVSVVDVKSPVYLWSQTLFIAQQPGLLLNSVNNTQSIYSTGETSMDGRTLLKVCLGIDTSPFSIFERSCRAILIYLDYWEY